MNEKEAPLSMKSTSSHDVAVEAGVSQSTVSRVFRKPDSVSPATVTKVREAAERLGYRPHAMARTLITGRSKIIGVYFSHEDHSFVSSLLFALSGVLQPLGYTVMTFIAPERTEDAEDVVSRMLEYRLDGLLIGSVDASDRVISLCQQEGLPIVLCNRSLPHLAAPSVASDDFAGGMLAAETLMRTGHTRLALILGRETATTSIAREEGFRAAVEAQSVARLVAVESGDFDHETARDAARKLLGVAKDQRPDAIFAVADLMALEVLSVARVEYGLSVPQDVSVIGYDNVPLAASPMIALTTIAWSLNDLAAQAVAKLLSPYSAPGTTLPVHLVSRATVRGLNGR